MEVVCMFGVWEIGWGRSFSEGGEEIRVDRK